MDQIFLFWRNKNVQGRGCNLINNNELKGNQNENHKPKVRVCKVLLFRSIHIGKLIYQFEKRTREPHKFRPIS